MQLDLELVTAALGARPRSLEPLCQGGYTRSLSWRVETSNGPAFVKQADDEGSLHMLRREALVYEHVRGPFLPGYFGFADAGCRAVLAIELLEEAYWPPPYPADVKPLFRALEGVAAVAPPAGLPSWKQPPPRWEQVAADVSPLVGLGLCSDAWLERALPTLIAAERDAVSVGDDLVHNDVYSGNVSFVDDRAVLVDWGAAVKGHAGSTSRTRSSASASRAASSHPSTCRTRARTHRRLPVTSRSRPRPLPEWTPADSTLRKDMIGDLAHALRRPRRRSSSPCHRRTYVLLCLRAGGIPRGAVQDRP